MYWWRATLIPIFRILHIGIKIDASTMSDFIWLDKHKNKIIECCVSTKFKTYYYRIDVLLLDYVQVGLRKPTICASLCAILGLHKNRETLFHIGLPYLSQD